LSRFRGLVLVAILVVISVVVLAISEVSVLGFTRGGDSPLGLSLGLDLEGGTHLVYKVVSEEGQGEPSKDDMEGLRNIIDRRVNEFGVSEATVQLLGGGIDSVADRVMVQIPGQTGSAITLNFAADLVSPEELERFFRENLGRSDASVKQNTNGSLVVQLDKIQGEVRDIDGNVVTESEADGWREAVTAEYPVALQLGYGLVELDPPIAGDDTADDAEEPGIETLPTLGEVEAAFASVGRGDASIEAVPGADGLFSITMHGLDTRSTDNEGNPIFGEDQQLIAALRDIGNLQFNAMQGSLTQWAVGGGVQEAKNLIGKTAKLEFRYRECGDIEPPSPSDPWPPNGMTIDQWLIERCTNPVYFQERPTTIDPADLDDAFPDISGGAIPRPIVTLVFNDDGGDAFFNETDDVSRHNDRLAIYLDGEELVAPGVSQGGIAGGRAIIEGGDFTTESVRTIAIQLRSGALPRGLELIQERNVDAVLGKDSLQKSLIAGGVGLILLLIFMISYYKIPGLVASIALIAYSIMLLGIFKMIPVTLTLSGAAAVILSLGFAVDANVLIAERTKEELRSGRSLLAAITAGFDRAWPSIRDGNMSTIIVAIVLFWFGDRFSTSVMQGFALTLAIGVLLSMFTAFFASRLLLRLVATSRIGNNTNLFVPVRDQKEPSESAPGGNS
jgi:protein-export membrane protein SecD